MSEVLLRFLKTIAAGPAWLLLGVLRGYQRIVSPLLPAVFGPACGCRFHPTCSHYAVEAVRTRGVLIGLGLTFWRLVRCTPLHPGGFDPVPLPKTNRVRTNPRPKRRAVRCVRVLR